MSKLVLIDGNAIIHRAYHSMPKTLSTRRGEQTNAVYGFAITLIKVLEDLKPDYIAATFDLAGPTFRHKVYADYKATRVKADQELYDQIPRVKKLVTAFGIPIYEMQGYEADDVIGTIVARLADKSEILNPPTSLSELRGTGKSETNPNDQNSNSKTKNLQPNAYNLKTYIVSGDKDIYQLINGNVKVYNLKKGLSQTQIIDSEAIKTEYGLDPHDFIDLKALAGDASDNIPGVPGVGIKTATQLLQEFDTLENLYATIEKSEILNPPTSLSELRGTGKSETNPKSKIQNLKPRIMQLLIENKEQAFLSQHLATIHTDVPIDFDLEKCKWGEYDKDKLRELFEELGFQSLLRRFGAMDTTEELNDRRTKKQVDSISKDQEQTEGQKRDEQLRLL